MEYENCTRETFSTCNGKLNCSTDEYYWSALGTFASLQILASFLNMTADCTSYYNPEKLFVNGFTCPKQDSDGRAVFCCGFNDMKYCCDDPNSFFPYEYGYMWWLSMGALVGLSIAAVVLLAFIITLCVLCYLFIATKPNQPDNGLPLRTPGSDQGATGGPSISTAPAGPQGFRKHFLNRKLDCDNQPPDPDRLFQRCFMATVTTVNVEGPS